MAGRTTADTAGNDDLGVLAGVGLLADWTGQRPPVPHGAALLRTPIGLDEHDRPLWLDLKESALGGTGPHGLVVGATGSGKSELLRTLVLGLTLTHPSDLLNMVLVDFKGGATFTGLDRLPHCSALITNLAEETHLVERMQDALGGELVRRQEVLRAAGNLTSLAELDAARALDPSVPTMPHLLVVVDEFSELLSAQPDFIDLFVAMGRVGRSLGIHLLLASQRLEEGRLRGLESHLSYRIGLRTFSAAESRAVLGVTDAHELPATPGVGLLRTDSATLTRFTTSYVSGRVPRPDPATGPAVLPLRLADVPLAEATEEPVRPDDRTSLLTAAVAAQRHHGPPAHQVWLPPLQASRPLGRVLGGLTRDPQRGLQRVAADLDPLVVPVAEVDRPRDQRREPWAVDLSGDAGHLAVVGGARCGKTGTLHTVVAALALTHTPAEAEFHLLDPGGNGFGALATLPHVASVATRNDPDRLRRVLAEVRAVMDRREAWFAEHRITHPADFRRSVRAGTGDGHGEVFVVVDNFAALRADFEDTWTGIADIAARGLGLGVHLLLSATRWSDLRAGVRDLVGTRIELKLGDPLDSEVDRRTAAKVPAHAPGRGLNSDGEHLLVAFPALDEPTDDDHDHEQQHGLQQLVDRIARAWPGQRAPQVPRLPTRIDREAIGVAPHAGRWVLGTDEGTGTAACVDLDRTHQLLVVGDPGSGRTTALRGLVRELLATNSPEQVQLVLVDPRRSLFGEVPASHLLASPTHPAAIARTTAGVVETLSRRLPTDDVNPGQLRERSWWQGPEVWVVVDDLDLVSSNRGSPLDALVPLLPQARDVGLHLVAARRTGGAGRAMFEPLLQVVRELGAPGLLLAGSPEEGVLVGNSRARPGVPGRAQWVTRDGVRVVQVAWVEPR